MKAPGLRRPGAFLCSLKNEGYNYGPSARIEEGRTIYSAVAVPPFEYSYIKLYLFENHVKSI